LRGEEPQKLHPIGVVAADAPPVVPLRLAAARGRLGLELYKPVDLPPLQLVGLSISLHKLRFPVDLSGGVHAFRHSRGLLQQLRLSASQDALARFLFGAWKDALGGLSQPPSLWASKGVVHVGLLGEKGALAFDLLWAPDGEHARVIVDNARAGGAVGVPLATALQLVGSALGVAATRRGRVFVCENLGYQVGCAVLPQVGARAPQVEQGTVSALQHEGEQWTWLVDPALPPPALSDHALRCLELAESVRRADDALVEGALDTAREEYLRALELAPMQPQMVRLIAEIDVALGGREDAALAMLRETVPLPSAGALAGELLAGTGELERARESFDQAIRGEPYAPVAALWALRASELEPDERTRLAALDRAVALAPALNVVRRARVLARARLGDTQGAWADAQHLEAAASGARARHDALCLAARALLGSGWVKEAGRIFERALRYVPDDPGATLGLAQSFLATGQVRRAIALLERAIALSERSGESNGEALLTLARALADELSDVPQAVARVRQVPAQAACVHEARALEAQWLEQLGDLAGAGLAYARLRQAVELALPQDAERVAQWLVRASQFESPHDLNAAERHLAVALRLRPHDPQLQVQYRQTAAQLAAQRRSRRLDSADD
jgi:tetratricopeptide (TPR) repeat protein